MCGRFVVANVGDEVVGMLRVDVVGDALPEPSFNVAPTDRVGIVLDSAKTAPPVRRFEGARWGLVPGWAKDLSIGSRAFNARSEELEDKPMFRSAMAKRRAIVPATGYYEWQRTADGKTPHFIHPVNGDPVLFAGLYEWWKAPSTPQPVAKEGAAADQWVLSFTVLTRDASAGLESIHDRMPVFMDPDHADAWLDPTADNPRDILDAAVDAAPRVADTLEAYPVSAAVGNVRNNGPALIEPLPDHQ